jgi:hypothetical protein
MLIKILNTFAKTFKIFDEIEESNKKKLWDYLKTLATLCSYFCKNKEEDPLFTLTY